MPELTQKKWFECWFNSPYYHLLYKDRNYDEAELFINNLLQFLNPKPNTRFLDLGCGKGRHAIYLHKQGLDVTGVDLSKNSIAYAQQFENEHLHFYVHDMRKLFRTSYFDVVVNLFTSFGYFENTNDDNATIKAVFKALKPNGIFVLDFMNSNKVIANLKTHETKKIEGIEFAITKKIEHNFIVKQIEFSDNGHKHHFEERVKALTLNDFEKYLQASELKILHLFGNYQLEHFDATHSDRLIIIAQK